MKSIASFVRDGINDMPELKAALQIAIQLEFSTIPPYLCAEWAIDRNEDPSKVRTTIHEIVLDEMYHFARAGNILSAIGGMPSVATPDFVVTYPSSELPGGIALTRPVDLCPLSQDQLDVFMNIEYPEFPPVALAKDSPATIGAFYTRIGEAILALSPAIDANANFITIGEDVKQIRSIADAIEAIVRIKGEGEGTEGDPNQPPPNATVIAHYYQFKAVRVGKTLIRDSNGKWHFSGADITMPKSLPFPKRNQNADASLDFNRQLARVLTDIQACWKVGLEFDASSMGMLRTKGVALIKANVRPEFVWAEPH